MKSCEKQYRPWLLENRPELSEEEILEEIRLKDEANGIHDAYLDLWGNELADAMSRSFRNAFIEAGIIEGEYE